MATEWGFGPVLNRDLSVSVRIAFAILIILTAVAACFLYNSTVQHRLVLMTYDTLDTRVPAMMAAKRVKIALLSHDDVLFRYLATRDDTHLGELQAFERATRAEISTLASLTTSKVVRSRLDLLSAESERYFTDTDHLISFARHSDHPKDVNFFGAATLLRKQNAQRQELDLLSAEGSARLLQLFSLCDEMVTLNRAALEQSQLDMHAVLATSRTAILRATLGTALFTLLVGLWLAFSLIAPLKLLLKGIERVEAGDYSVEIPITSDATDELGRMTLAFNRMMKTVNDQRHHLEEENTRDGMTGLFNHRHFRLVLKQEVERSARTGASLSLLMIDIDFFKTYNDSQGHEFGNELLKGICHVLKENLRDMDTLARYGGDELCAILPGMNAEAAKIVGERLRQAAASVRFPGSDVFSKKHVTLSIGGASFPRDASSSNDMIIKADAALYDAKSHGRDILRWFKPPLTMPTAQKVI